MRRASGCVAIMAICALSSCSSGSSKSSSPTTPIPGATSASTIPTTAGGASKLGNIDPCTLLDPQVVRQAVGNAVGAAEHAGTACNWRSGNLGDVDVVLILDPLGDPVAKCARAGKASTGRTVSAVNGLGTTAYFDYRAAGAASNGDLTVCRKDGLVLLGLVGNKPNAAMQAAAVALARHVLAKLS